MSAVQKTSVSTRTWFFILFLPGLGNATKRDLLERSKGIDYGYATRFSAVKMRVKLLIKYTFIQSAL